MRDIDDRTPFRLEPADDLKQMLRLRNGQRGRGFVHDDHARVVGNGLRDLDCLELRHRKVLRQRLWLNIKLKVADELFGLLIHLCFVHKDALCLKPADPNIIDDVAIRHGNQLLMDHRDSLLERIVCVPDCNGLAIELDGAAVRLIDAEEALHQRGFSRAVLADQRVNGTGLDPKLYIIQRFYARKCLRHVFYE